MGQVLLRVAEALKGSVPSAQTGEQEHAWPEVAYRNQLRLQGKNAPEVRKQLSHASHVATLVGGRRVATFGEERLRQRRTIAHRYAD